jgi:DNA polymerase epsilon subunit 2
MVDHFNLTDLDDPDTLEAFVEAMEKMAQSYTNDTEDYAQIVTVAGLEEVYARLQAVEGDVDALNGAAMPASAAAAAAAAGLRDGETLDPATYTRIIDSFDMPWLHFDGEKRAFVHHNNLSSANASGAAGASSREANRKKPSLAGAPDSKAMYLRDRYNILKQVILRNEHFSPPALPGHDRDSYMKVGWRQAYPAE